MKNELNDIDLFIRNKISNSSFSVPEKEWEMLSRHMSVKNFFRFNAGQINVFYIGAVAVLMSISGIFYAQNLKLKKNIRKMEQIIQENSLKISIEKPKEDALIKDETEESKEVEHVSLTKSRTIDKSESSKKHQAEPEILVTKKDTVIAVNEENTKPVDTFVKKPSRKIVKKKVYVKNGPVILKDTVIQLKNEK